MAQGRPNDPGPLQCGRPALQLGGWKCSACVLGACGIGTLSFYGLISNLVIYLVQVCGQTNAAAAQTVANLSGTLFVCSFVGAFVSDAYMGRFWATVVFQIISLLLYVVVNIIVVAISVQGSATDLAVTSLLVSLYLITITAGPVLPCIVALGADQLSAREDKEMYFLLLVISNSIGELIAVTAVSYVDNEGMWVWGSGLCTIAAAISGAFIVGGGRWFRSYKPSGNPFLRNLQVLVAAWRKRSLTLPTDSSLLYKRPHSLNISAIDPGQPELQHTTFLTFLDKAAVLGQNETFSPWHLCTVSQVEELKSLVRVMPVGLTIVVGSVVNAQINTLFQEQASVMNRKVGTWLTLPPASLNLFSIASAILTGIAVTTHGTRLSRWCLGVHGRRGRASTDTSLQLLGAALVCCILAMVIAAVVESYRLSQAKEGFLISVFWLMPQTLLIGVLMNFVQSGGFNFLYSKVSESMRSVGGSFQLLFAGAGNYLSALLVTLVTAITTQGGRQAGWIANNLNEGHVDYFYWFLASVSTLSLCIHLVFARSYTYAGGSYVDEKLKSEDQALMQNLLP